MEDWTPEAIERFRKYERERVKKYYQENLAPKVQCPICAKEVSQGWLEKHQESRLCKPFGSGPPRDFTEKDQARRSRTANIAEHGGKGWDSHPRNLWLKTTATQHVISTTVG